MEKCAQMTEKLLKWASGHSQLPTIGVSGMLAVKNNLTAAQFGYHRREYEGYLRNIGLTFDPGA